MVRSRWACGAALLTLLLAIATPARADRDLVGITQAKFTWSAASGPVSAYRIYVERNGGGFLPHPTTPTKPVTDRVVVVVGSYGDVIRVQVAAISSVDGSEGPRSDPSEWIRFVAPPPPPEPTPTPTPTPEPAPAPTPSPAPTPTPSPAPTPTPSPAPTPPPAPAPTPTPLPPAETSPDFDGDGQADLLLREGASGNIHVWTMDENGPSASMRVGVLPTTSAIAGNGDYDGDGHADLLSRDDTTTAVNVHLLVDGAVVGGGQVVPALDPAWELAGSGDFDGNGRDDILLRNPRARRLEIWFMNGPEIESRTRLLDPYSTTWQVAGVADFSGDRRADILWYSSLKKRATVSLLDASFRISRQPRLFKSLPNGDVVATGDTDGNGLPDVVTRTRDTGRMQIWLTGLAKGKPKAVRVRSLNHEAFLPSGSDGLAGFEVQGGGDFDGDDRMDLVVRDAKAGDLRVWFLDEATVSDEVRLTDPGSNWVFEGVGAESPSTHR
jgi:FG-GAP-like repeat